MKKKQFRFFALIVFFLIAGKEAVSQVLKFNLSSKHITRIEHVKSANKKLAKYRKYFSKDSASQMKRLTKVYRRKLDSIGRHYAAAEKLRLWREKRGIKESIDTLALLQQYASLIPKDTTGKVKTNAIKWTKEEIFKNIQPEQQKQLIELQSKFGFSPQEAKQYMDGDSAARKKIKTKALHSAKERAVANLPADQRKQVEVFQKEYGPYSKEVKQYLYFLKDSVDRLDTLKSLAANKSQEQAERMLEGNLMNNSELKKLNEYRKQLDQLKDSPAEYQKKLEQYKNKENLEKEVKDYLAKDPTKFKLLQTKMSTLMKKYSFIENSNDLSTAIKRTSLKGRPFRERLLIATNFQIIATQPFSIDLAPMIGYKFNSKFSAGLGGTYRQTFKDSIPSLSPNVWGLKSFISYDVFKTFFAYGEGDLNTPGLKSIEGKSFRIWSPAVFIGIGKRFNLHKNVDVTTIVLYNFLSKNRDSIYPEPLIFRVGFQLSELALKKR
jgi:hypothetical protein